MSKRAAKRQGTQTDWPVRVTGSGRRLTEKALDRAQDELGVAFPRDYRRFMLAHNGGDPNPACFVYYNPKQGSKVAARVEWLCWISNSLIDSLNLRGQQAMLHRYAAENDPYPMGCICIGGAVAGASLLLFVLGKRKGQVWLKVWEETRSNPKVAGDPEEALYKLAGSFRGFLRMLCSDEEAERRAPFTPPRRRRRSSKSSPSGR